MTQPQLALDRRGCGGRGFCCGVIFFWETELYGTDFFFMQRVWPEIVGTL